uniref:DnaJ heat shock protein family (Hsp40) member C8 n=1 Tax=Rattus norvegicus TaxID=10116 RepID=A0A8I5ZVD5_RAT
MAASGESGASGGGGSTEEAFMTFYSEVKQIEKRDSVLTSKNQIERLTRPGSSYFNLNPFEVLQIDPEVTDEEIKKRFRQLSILVHPDKNQDDADRAQKAFEAVDKAYKLLLDQEQKKRALDVIQAGKEYVEHTQLKKEGKPTNVEEDDPELFKQAVYKQTMKLFAELEIKRKEREAKEMHERCLSLKVGMVEWTVGEISRQIQRARRRRRIGPSCGHRKSRWSSGSERRPWRSLPGQSLPTASSCFKDSLSPPPPT